MNLILFRLVDMSFNEMFSDPQFKYIGPTEGSSFH